MRGSDAKMCFSEKERRTFWKDYMERITNEEDDWDRNVEGDAVEGPVLCESREEVLQALNEMKTGKCPGRSEESLELIASSGDVKIYVMADISHNVLDGFGIPVEWALSIVVPIFKGKGDIRTCNCHRAVNIHEQDTKTVETMFEKRLCKIVSVDEMQFGSIPKRGAIDAVFILRRMQEVHHAKVKKFYMHLVDLE